VVPFQIDPSWYEHYWLTEHPPRRRGALAERIRWRRKTSSRHPVWSEAAGFRAPTPGSQA